MNEIEQVGRIVERMRDTKAIRHLKSEVRDRIEELLIDDEFTMVFKEELKIENELSEEQIALIVELLLRELI